MKKAKNGAIFMEEDEFDNLEETLTKYRESENNSTDATHTIEGPSLYEINKQLVDKLPVISRDNLNNYKQLIIDYAESLKDAGNYFMLLNNEYRYYTVFHLSHLSTNYINFSEEVIELLKEFYEIKSIEKQDDMCIEIWGKVDKMSEIGCFYLFPYDRGVIEVE